MLTYLLFDDMITCNSIYIIYTAILEFANMQIRDLICLAELKTFYFQRTHALWSFHVQV
jgi:hypothetical protein